MQTRAGIVAILLLLGTPVLAQTDLERFERQLEQIRRDTRLLVNPAVPAEQRTFFDYGAFTTAGYLSLDDSDLDNHILWQYDLTAFARINLDGVHEFFVRGRAYYRDFHEGDEFDDDDENEVRDARLERAYYRFDLARYLGSTQGKQIDGDIAVKLGRDLVYWGNGLTLSQELDGVVADFEYGPFALELIAGCTPRDSVDIDASRPDFDDDTKRAFYGALLAARVGTHRPYTYVLVQRDHNTDNTAVNDIGGVDVTTVFKYNSQYFGLGSTGALSDRLAYGVELVFEAGKTLDNSFSIAQNGSVVPITQGTDDIHAWAFDAQLDYLLPDARHTRLSGELILATGDSDRLTTSSIFGGNLEGTQDNAFNGFGLVNMGLAFAPVVSNVIVLRGGVSTFPFPDVKMFQRMQVGLDLFAFGKFDSNAPIDEATNDDRFLGFEPDLFLNWQITSDVTLAVRYGAFVPGAAIEEDGKIRQFIYAGVTFAF